MEINITKEQYKVMMHHLEVSSWVYGLLGDMVNGSYKENYNDVEKLKTLLYTFAKEMDYEQYLMHEEGYGSYLNENESKKIDNVIDEFENWAFHTRLFQLYVEKQGVGSCGDQCCDEDCSSLDDVFRKEEELMNVFYENLEKYGSDFISFKI